MSAGEAKISRVGLYAIENSHTTGASAMNEDNADRQAARDQKQTIAVKHAGFFPA